MENANVATAVAEFRSPTVADIPGLLPDTAAAAAAPGAAEPAANDSHQPDFGAARSMLDFIDRMGSRLRPGAQRFVQAVVPEIRDVYRCMHVELDHLNADLDEARRAIARLLAGEAPARAPGDGYVQLGLPVTEGARLEEERIESAYQRLCALTDTIGRMGSERLTQAVETIETGFLSLESELRHRVAQLARAGDRLEEMRAATGGAAIPGPDTAPEPPTAADLAGIGLSAAQCEFFAENGYVGPLTLCSPEEMARIRRWIDRSGFMHRGSPVYASGSPRASAEARDWHLVFPEIYELCTHPAIVAAMEAVLGPDLILWRSQFMRKEAGAPALAWHQDGSFPGGKLRPAVNPVKTVSAWLAIDEATVDNGCVWVVPGTHREELKYERRDADRGQGLFRRGFEVEYQIPQDRAVAMTLQPGQFMLFDCQTLHGSSHNPSPWRRLGLATRYTSADVRVYEGQTEDGQGYALDRFGCVLVQGEDRCGHNVMAQPPRR